MSRRNAEAGGCSVILGFMVLALLLALLIYGFQHAPIATGIVLGMLVLVIVAIAKARKTSPTKSSPTRDKPRSQMTARKVAPSPAASTVALPMTEEQSAVAKVKQRAAKREANLAEDEICVALGDADDLWRVTRTWLIRGYDRDAPRWPLAGHTITFDGRFFVIIGPYVETAVRYFKLGPDPSPVLRETLEAKAEYLTTWAVEAGTAHLNRRCEPFCRCPAGHEGLHNLDTADDDQRVLRPAGECGQSWTELR